MFVPTGITFKFELSDFKKMSLNIQDVSFISEYGVFKVQMFLEYGIFESYFVERLPNCVSRRALQFLLKSYNLPQELAANAVRIPGCNALAFTFFASIEAYDGEPLEKEQSLIEDTDYRFLSFHSVEIGPTGAMKLDADPIRIGMQALTLLPKRFHWIAYEGKYQQYIRKTDAGFFLNLKEIDYETVIEDDSPEEGLVDNMTYVFVNSELRLWK